MIIISVLSLMVSFLLQGLMSNLFNYTINNLSLFSTIYVVVNLVVLLQYFEDDRKFFIFIIVVGLCMDIVYNGTAFVSVFILFLIFYINKLLTFFLPYNLFTVNLFSFISVIIYHFVTFIFLIILKYDSYSIFTLLKIIGSNIVMTFIYTCFLYYIISFIVKKFDLKIIR